MIHKFHAGDHGQAAAAHASAGFGQVLDSLAAPAPDSASDRGDSSGGHDASDSIAGKGGQAGNPDAENAQAALVLAIPDSAKTKPAKDTDPAAGDVEGAAQAAQDAGDAPSAAAPSADSQSTDVAGILAQLAMASSSPTPASKDAQAAKAGDDPSPSSAKPAGKTQASSPPAKPADSSGKSEAGDPSLADPGGADSGLGDILAQAATQSETAPSQTAASAAEGTDSSKSASPSKAQKEKAQKEKDGPQAKSQTAPQAAQPAALLVALPLPVALGTAAAILQHDPGAKGKDDTVGPISGGQDDSSKKTTPSVTGRTIAPSQKPSATASGKAAVSAPPPDGPQQTDISSGAGAAAPAKASATGDDRKSAPAQTSDKPGFAVLQAPAAQQKPPGVQDGSLLAQTPLPPQGASDGPSVTQHVQVVDSQPANIAALAIAIAAKSQSGNKEFDIRLDPPELGRVDVRLSIDQSGKAQASLSADRPRTLDLLRNDAPQLTRALRDAGLNMAQNGLNFSLRGQDRQNGNSNFSARNGRPSRSLKAISAIGAVKGAPHYQGPAQGRLDIRV